MSGNKYQDFEKLDKSEELDDSHKVEIVTEEDGDEEPSTVHTA